MIVAPLSANTMAKLANGLCDNLVVSRVVLTFTQFWRSYRLLQVYMLGMLPGVVGRLLACVCTVQELGWCWH